jgi:hypothetical protein
MNVQIKYKTAVMVPAGWRSVMITAQAEQISVKRAQVVEVVAIDGESPDGYTSRTGAKRQTYNAAGIAEREKGKIKILSKCAKVTKQDTEQWLS